MAKTLFKKTMLKIGRRISPDGIVDITPGRLRHWESQFRNLRSNNYEVPMHWDHASSLDELQPVPRQDFERKERSSKNSVGRMADFKVLPSGDAAEVTYEVHDPVAANKLENNTVFLSPVILPRFRDGTGKNYQDLITHLDVVDYPVDNTQSKTVRAEPPMIACAIRFGLGAPIFMGTEMPYPNELDDENDLGMDDDTDALEVGEDSDDDSDNTGAADDDDASLVGEMLLALADHEVILPNDTTMENFMDRLKTALIAKKGAEPGAGQPDSGQQGPGANNDVMVADPQIATMTAYASTQYQKSIRMALTALLKTGRCSPAEYREQEAKLGAVRLSLGTDGRPKGNKVTEFIRNRQGLPAGAVWSAKQRLAHRMGITEAKPPERVLGAGASMSDEEIDAFLANKN